MAPRKNGARGLQENGRGTNPFHSSRCCSCTLRRETGGEISGREAACPCWGGLVPFGWKPLPGTTAFQSSIAPPGQAALARGGSAAAGLFRD